MSGYSSLSEVAGHFWGWPLNDPLPDNHSPEHVLEKFWLNVVQMTTDALSSRGNAADMASEPSSEHAAELLGGPAGLCGSGDGVAASGITARREPCRTTTKNRRGQMLFPAPFPVEPPNFGSTPAPRKSVRSVAVRLE